MKQNIEKPSIMSTIRSLSTLFTRTQLASKLGQTYGGDRNVYTALGYKTELTNTDYLLKFERQDIANRIVKAPVATSWRKLPEVVEVNGEETTFEKSWEELQSQFHIYSVLRKADVLAGLGEYAVVLIGYKDGKRLAEPVEQAREVLYLAPYHQDNAIINTWETDQENPRYGMPLIYKLRMSVGETTGTGANSTETLVHYSRILHIAENTLENTWRGAPRLREVYNRLDDIEKLVGGSAEMFWRGAFPGISFETEPDANLEAQDLDDVQDEVEKYMHGMQRYLRLQGMKANSLTPQIAAPGDHLDAQLQLVSSQTNIPVRILVGSERGELASGQDENNWHNFIAERRDTYVSSSIMKPLIDSWIKLGILPKPTAGDNGYAIIWPDLSVTSDKEKAEIGKIDSEAISKYAGTPGANMVVPPNFFLKDTMGYNQDQVDEINKELNTMVAETDVDEELEEVEGL